MSIREEFKLFASSACIEYNKSNIAGTNMKTQNTIPVSTPAKLSFLKLAIRSLLFAAVLTVFLTDKRLVLDNVYTFQNSGAWLLAGIWLFFVVEMAARLFPLKFESIGSQKQFASHFVRRDTGTSLPADVKKNHRKSVILVAALWIALNAGIGALFFTGIIDEAVLLIISLFFAVCDIVCILFYCPFQSLIMKNRCCTTCRIFNWDFLMMFIPLVFIRSWFTLSLVALALTVFIQWEIQYFRHPARFCEETNGRLACAACTENLCRWKKTVSLPGRLNK